jgi:hypothetical protein
MGAIFYRLLGSFGKINNFFGFIPARSGGPRRKGSGYGNAVLGSFRGICFFGRSLRPERRLAPGTAAWVWRRPGGWVSIVKELAGAVEVRLPDWIVA